MSEVNSFEEFCSACKSIDGYCIFRTTDQFLVDYWHGDLNHPEEIAAKLLEARIFNDKCEYLLFRSCIGDEFSFRKIDPEDEVKGNYSDFCEQRQFLDIDSNRSRELFRKKQVVTTTGGSNLYKLPVKEFNEDACVTIRYYIDRYANSGQARVFDWRVVRIEGGCD